jgi:uncharacterized membrane protein
MARVRGEPRRLPVPERETTPESPIEPPYEERPGVADLFVEKVSRLSFIHVLLVVYVGAALFIFTFLSPPFQKPDEQSHYYRSVSLTNLDITCSPAEGGKGAFLMKRRYFDLPAIMHTWDVYLVYDNKFDRAWFNADFSDPALNDEVAAYDICNLPAPGYFPNAAGVLIGKPFENPLIGFYLARIFGAVFFVVAMVIAIRLTPGQFRPPLYLYAILPTVLHQVSAVSYDAVQLSLFPLTYAYLTRFITQEGPIPRRDLFIFAALIIWNIQVRGVTYLPIALLFFAVRPFKIHAVPRQYLMAAGAFAAVVLATTVVSSLVYLPNVESAPLDGSEGIRPGEQVRFVINHPWDFLMACYNAMNHQGEWMIKQSMAAFGWIDTSMNWFPYFALLFAAGAIFYFMVDRAERLMSPVQIAAVLGAVLFTSLWIFFSLYAVWSNVGADEVQGVQGRYFVGLMPFAMLGLSQLAGYVTRKVAFNVTLLVIAAMLLYQIYRAIDLRYYG